MSAADVTPFLVPPGHLAVTAPVAELGALLVDQAGRRFADERSDRLTLARAIRRCPGGVAYLVFDDRIAGAARQADPFFATTVLPRAGRRAETLADLARQYELGTDALETSVASHVAAAMAAGRPPLAAPFHAIRVTGARRRTLGGLAVDARARVLGADGQPIAGLYATGGAAAGLAAEGARTAMPGTVALAALGFARIAALQVMGVPEPEVGE